MGRDGYQIPSVGRMIEKATVPARSVGIFWLGGCSLAFKSQKQQVYMVDPVFSDWKGEGPAGAIDVRPDLVLCTLQAPEGIDLSTLTHLATAFPEARFVGSEESRDWMIGRAGIAEWDEVPINPDRVHALEDEVQLDVRRLGVLDAVRVRVLPGAEEEAGGPWNVLFNFAGLQMCLVRRISGPEALEEICGAIRRRVDVLIWSLDGEGVEAAGEAVDRLRPRYAIPIGYDRLAGGRTAARRFRDLVGGIPGVKVYLFAEDYQEGLIYSRIMSRPR